MKKSLFRISTMVLLTFVTISLSAQNKTGGINSITSSDIESHLSLLASPLLKGRKNGGEGLEIAANYISSQVKKIGLKPVTGNYFINQYTIIKKEMNPEKTFIQVAAEGQIPVQINESFYSLIPMGVSDFAVDGDVVFAGYGIKSDKYDYNDLDSLQTAGKILLIMDRAPSTPDGKKCLFDDQQWMNMTGLQMKIQTLMFTGSKAILIVTDPKSGTSSIEETYPDLSDLLQSGMTLKGQKNQVFDFPGMPKILFVHRKVADELLKGTGTSLTDLQNAIDNELRSHSFEIKGKQIKINEVSQIKEEQLPNVAGMIEGSDPVLKNEIVIFSGHMDHIGEEGGTINAGADDNASGCAALLEIAEAFQDLRKKPLRSLLFLWVSGEEIGLFGSESYINNPLHPLEKTVANINIDMIGRVKGAADTSDQNPMSGPNSVFVISDNQSKELKTIAGIAAKKTNLTLDYSLSGRDHPLMLWARSDGYNFIQKDIPVLSITTGLPSDYHTPGDVIEKIDFPKMELITKTVYEIGYKVANRKTRIVVDNPFSKWTNATLPTSGF